MQLAALRLQTPACWSHNAQWLCHRVRAGKQNKTSENMTQLQTNGNKKTSNPPSTERSKKVHRNRCWTVKVKNRSRVWSPMPKQNPKVAMSMLWDWERTHASSLLLCPDAERPGSENEQGVTSFTAQWRKMSFRHAHSLPHPSQSISSAFNPTGDSHHYTTCDAIPPSQNLPYSHLRSTRFHSSPSKLEITPPPFNMWSIPHSQNLK